MSAVQRSTPCLARDNVRHAADTVCCVAQRAVSAVQNATYCLNGVRLVGRPRRYLEAGVFFLSTILYGAHVVGRERRYLAAGVLTPAGGLAGRGRSRA